MEILIKITINSSRTNKGQRVDSFRKDENKGKKSISRMGWFCYSRTVEFLNVRWPFIMWWSKEGQVDWLIKIQKLSEFKEKDNNKVLFLVLHTKKESLLFIQNILIPTISSHIHLFRISNINQTWFRTFQDKWKYHLKNRNWRTVSNIKYNK